MARASVTAPESSGEPAWAGQTGSLMNWVSTPVTRMRLQVSPSRTVLKGMTPSLAVMAQAAGALPPGWETWIEFPALGAGGWAADGTGWGTGCQSKHTDSKLTEALGLSDCFLPFPSSWGEKLPLAALPLPCSGRGCHGQRPPRPGRSGADVERQPRSAQLAHQGSLVPTQTRLALPTQTRLALVNNV